MFNRFIPEKRLHQAYIFLCIVLAIFIPLNKVGLSITTLLLGLLTLFFTPLTRLKETFKTHKSSLLVLVLLGWSLLSLSWTKDLASGFKYINLILPFYIVFFVLALRPIRAEKERFYILNAFILATFGTALTNWIVYSQQTDYYHYDMREMSLFTSHIRFALMVVIALVLSVYYFFKTKQNWKWLYLPIGLFLLYYTYRSEVISGYISVTVALVGALIYTLFHFIPNKKIAWSLTVIFILGTAFTGGIIATKLFSRPHFNVLTHTKQGNLYWSDTTNTKFENGYPINVNIQVDELNDAWQKRSAVALHDLAKNGMTHQSNLIRYMTSKGLNKDAEGISKLTKKDIQNVENGFISIYQEDNSMRTRLQNIADELAYRGNDPNGLTFLQRLEYWKAGLAIVNEHRLVGVGAGSSKAYFLDYYDQTNSKLATENRRESHQQFLSIAVNFGLVGLGIFVLLLIFVFLETPQKVHYYLILAILLVSFLNEDTLETQTGGTLVAFFFSFLSGISVKGQQQQNRLDN
ncbi:MAG TPA: O-antigen ligase family protein [Crocinitomicaceae bacterium]|nr:O-antigen ligase family protein [Crocinitomicaceae bacterium]